MTRTPVRPYQPNYRKWGATMHTLSEQESHLSAKLYGLLGGVSAEMAQLPTERTIETWTSEELLHAVCRCKDALIDALRCAVRLSRLGELDSVSQSWIDEALHYSEVDQEQLFHVEDDLVKECWSS